MEEAAKVLVVWPTTVTRRLDGPWLGVAFGVCAASGFAAAESAAFIVSQPLTALRVLRALVGIPAHPFFAGVWGYALGQRVRAGGRWFAPAWLFAVAAHALYDHIVFGRGPGMLAIALPMLNAMGLVTWSALRDIAPSSLDDGPGSPSLAPSRSGCRFTCRNRPRSGSFAVRSSGPISLWCSAGSRSARS